MQNTTKEMNVVEHASGGKTNVVCHPSQFSIVHIVIVYLSIVNGISQYHQY